MPICVQVEICFLSERFATNCALVGTLTAVDPAMDLHVVLETEAFIAHVTLVGLLPCVDNSVPTQLASIRADNVTVLKIAREVSRSRRLFFVSLHMALQTRSIEEVFVTDSALG